LETLRKGAFLNFSSLKPDIIVLLRSLLEKPYTLTLALSSTSRRPSRERGLKNCPSLEGRG